MSGKKVYVLIELRSVQGPNDNYPTEVESFIGIFSTQEKAEKAGQRLDIIENQNNNYWFSHYDCYEVKEMVIDDDGYVKACEDYFKVQLEQKEVDS